ncbi:hypothetical protein MBT84_01260 [Streptomyces sp. MBT84]|nr:hypothetical protein [Streptomyces sp. MBT84]
MSTLFPASPHPLRHQLPGVYAQDTFAGVFADGLDTMQGPVLTTLDCLDAYFRPGLAPTDFLDWIGAWVGAELQDMISESARREAVAMAVVMHRAEEPPKDLLPPSGWLSGSHRTSPRAVARRGPPGRAVPFPVTPCPRCVWSCGCPIRRRSTPGDWSPWSPRPAPHICPSPLRY